MTEYAGYIAVNPVDWSKVAKDATKDIVGVMEERQKQREELNNSFLKGQEQINKWTKSADSDMNKVLIAGAQNFRSYIQARYDALRNGDITQEQFKSDLSNATTNWKGLSMGVGQFGDNIQKHRQMVLDGTASGQQIENMKTYAKYTSMKNVSIEPGEDGRGYLKDVTSEDGAIIPFMSIADPTNFFSKKLELTKEVTSFMNSLAKTKYYDKERDVYVLTQKFDDALQKEAIYGILQNNDDLYGRMLDDNQMGYTFDKERAKRLGLKVIEQKLGPDGSMHAIITPEMKELAEKKLIESIEKRISYQEGDIGVAKKIKLDERKLDQRDRTLDIQEGTLGYRKNQGQQKIDIKRQEVGAKGKQEEEDYANRITAINEVIDSGSVGLLSTRPMSFQKYAGTEGTSGEVSQKYAGYTLNKIDKKGNEYYVTIKNADGKTAVLKYTKKGLISDLNDVFNSLEGEKNLSITKLNTMLPTGTTTATVAKSKPKIDTSRYSNTNQ